MNDSYGFIDAEKETLADDGTRKFTITKDVRLAGRIILRILRMA